MKIKQQKHTNKQKAAARKKVPISLISDIEECKIQDLIIYMKVLIE